MIREYSDNVSYNMLSSKQSYVKDFHLHNFYELFLLLEGEIDFCIQQTLYHLLPGSLIMINDLEIHKTINRKETPYKRIYIHIPPAFFDKYDAKDMDLTSCFTARKTGENNLIRLEKESFFNFISLYEQLAEHDKMELPGRELLLDTFLLQILIMVNHLFIRSSCHVPNSSYSAVVQDIMGYLEEHLLENISLDSLARTFARSKYHLCHAFKEEVGTTIFNYLLWLRIARAKSLLGEGHNVTEACFLSGFTNYNNFITTFKKHTGYTPKKYASSLQRKKHTGSRT